MLQIYLKFTIANTNFEDQFVVAFISAHLIILRMLFLQKTNTDINWFSKAINLT